MHIVSIGVIIGIIPQILVRFQQKRNKGERRFELPTLKRLLPLYIVYILMLVFWPTTIPLYAWQGEINFQALSLNERTVFIFRFIEYIAAFTLWGSMIAEMRGRREEALIKTLGWVFYVTVTLTVLFTIIKGFNQFVPASILVNVIFIIAGLYGGVIYKLQLVYIQSVLTGLYEVVV